MSSRHRRAAVTILFLAATLAVCTLPSAPASSTPRGSASGAAIPGLEDADLARPRIIVRPGDLPEVRARLDREPYRTLLAEVQARANGAPPPSIADQADCVETANRDREGAKSVAARNLAFLYLLDRVIDPVTEEVVTPTPAERQALGDRARDYLLAMCTEGRIDTDPDRDINTSHELLQLASAYDALLGGGYDFGADHDAVLDNLVGLTSDYYRQYTSSGGATFLVNNHRSKGAASIGVAALALAEYEAPAGSDPLGVKDPAEWLDFALDRTDLVVRWTYGAGDGGYGEGPHYWRFSAINIYPFLRAWDSVRGDAPWTTANGVTVPNLWRHPQFLAMQRWLLDHTLPDGTLAPIDDNKVDERMFWGAAPEALPERGAYYRDWLESGGPYDPGPYANTASIDPAVDEIVQFDDTVPAVEPAGSPTRFYPEGGSAVFRSDWSSGATLAIVSGEHGAAREFGRARDGLGEIWSAPHDHADPGSFLLHAYGERLLMDPGYMDYPWSLQWTMNKPSDHNMVLVSPAGSGATQSPDDPLTASTLTAEAAGWATDPEAPVPADGNGSITDTLDSAFVDAATVTARYGQPAGDSALVERRFLFVDDSYLVVLDDVSSPVARTYTWPLHGNGGGTDGVLPPTPALNPGQRPPLGADALPEQPYPASGGTFAETATGGEWTRPNARLTAGLAFDEPTPSTEVVQEYYEQRRKFLASYDTLRTSVTGTDVQAAQVLYPTPTRQAAPTITRVTVPGGTGLIVDDPAGDRRVLVVQRPAAGTWFDGTSLGFPTASTDGDVAIFDFHTDGRVRSIYAENASGLSGGSPVVHVEAREGAPRSTLGVHVEPDHAEILAPNKSFLGTGTELGFTPLATDGACSTSFEGGVELFTGTDERMTLSANPTLGLPSAGVIPGARGAIGTTVRLDGLDSCDDGAELEALTPTWTIVSAPPGSTRTLVEPSTFEPGLLLDAPGIYRVRLVVTDASGNQSLPVETTYLAGPPAGDGEDSDLDGWFDTADPDADGSPIATTPPAPTLLTYDATTWPDLVEITWSSTADGGSPVTRNRVTFADGRQEILPAGTQLFDFSPTDLAFGPPTVAVRTAIGWSDETLVEPITVPPTTTTSTVAVTTTTSPHATTTTSSTAPTTGPSTTVGGGLPTGSDPDPEPLPVTGSDPRPLVAVALGLIVLGGATWGWARRRTGVA